MQILQDGDKGRRTRFPARLPQLPEAKPASSQPEQSAVDAALAPLRVAMVWLVGLMVALAYLVLLAWSDGERMGLQREAAPAESCGVPLGSPVPLYEEDQPAPHAEGAVL